MGAPRFGSFLFGSLRGYRRAWLRADLLAGLAVWAVLVPESLAYAVLAGVPPVVGLWAAPAALVLYAALGSSRHLVVGPMSASAALSGVVVGGLAGGAGRVATLTAGRTGPGRDDHAFTSCRGPPPIAAGSTWLPCSWVRRRGSVRAARPSAR
jgi:MFS superfamily sulfate permease-like transporter